MDAYDNIIVFYFTGTGNAQSAAEWIVEEAKNKRLQTRLLNIAEAPDLSGLSITEKTLFGFCYPTHGFNAPPILLRFLRQFPKSKSSPPIFLLNTRAGMKVSKIFTPGVSGLAQILPALILCTKGYRVIGFRPIDLPSNWISIHPGLKETVVESIFLRCKHITLNFADKILSGKKVYRGLYDLPIDLIICPISIGYYLYGRFILSKTFIASNACNNCGLCEKNCPVDAIQIQSGKPYWKYNCESCMHCMNYCPQQAIQTPHGFITIVWWVAFALVPSGIVYLLRVSQLNTDSPFWNRAAQDIAGAFLGLAVVFGSYKLLHFLLRFSFVSKLVSATSLTSFKFWRRYKAPKTD